MQTGRAVDRQLCAGLVLDHVHIFAIEVGPLHLDAIADALACTDGEFIYGARVGQLVTVAIAFV